MDDAYPLGCTTLPGETLADLQYETMLKQADEWIEEHREQFGERWFLEFIERESHHQPQLLSRMFESIGGDIAMAMKTTGLWQRWEEYLQTCYIEGDTSE